MRIGRRPVFFLAVALACTALLPPTPAEFRWVNLGCAGLAIFWAVLLAIEDIATAGQGGDDREEPPTSR